MTGERKYMCAFCAKSIAKGGIDVTAIVLILKWDQSKELQKSQQLWCHAECFRLRVHKSVPLYAYTLAEGPHQDRATWGGGQTEIDKNDV